MKNRKIIGLSLLVILSACGVKGGEGDDDSDAKADGQYSYLFRQTVNGEPCSTGRKTASNHDEYCSMLADDAQNLDKKSGEVCARSLRAARVKSECPGVQMSQADDDVAGF